MKNRDIPDRFSFGWLDSLDSRLAIAREMRARYAALTDDLGGIDNLSYQQRSLCERALWLEFWLAQQERELASGNEFPVNSWIQGSNSLIGLYRSLGLERQAKSITLADYLESKS